MKFKKRRRLRKLADVLKASATDWTESPGKQVTLYGPATIDLKRLLNAIRK